MSRKEWNEEEIDFIKSSYKKMTNREIGEVLGRSIHNVKNILYRCGIKRSERIIKKFRSEVRKKKIKFIRVPCIYPELSDCWNCTSHDKNSYSYPYIKRNKKFGKMSRYVWKLRFGPIPEGMLVCHHCDNPKCINPEHLFLGTRKDNTQDMLKKGRDNCWGKGARLLTAKQAIEIFNSDELGGVLADKHNVSATTINNIKRRKHYREITANI